MNTQGRFVEGVIRAICGFVAAGFLAGCATMSKPEAAPDLGAVYEKCGKMLDAGDTNGVIKCLNKEVKNQAYGPQRGQLFGRLLTLMIRVDRLADAQKKYLWAAANDPELAKAGFDVLPGFFKSRNDVESLDAWSAKLMNLPLAPELVERAYMINMDACAASGAMDKVIELVPVCAKKFEGPAVRRIIGTTFASLVQKNNVIDAAKLIDATEVESVNIPELKNLVTVGRVLVAAMNERWSDCETLFGKAAAELPDGDLRICLTQVLARLKAKRQVVLGDRLCELVVLKCSGKQASREEAAGEWVKASRERNDVQESIRRLESAFDSGISAQFMLGLYNTHFYDLMRDVEKENGKKVIALGNKLLGKLTADADKIDLKNLLLDGSFLVDDFDGALKIIESGLTGREDGWQDMASSKIKAHIAARDGKYVEAVQHLQKFMTYIEKWEKPEEDPITGVAFTKELCLGVNWKRIGVWYDKAGKKNDAAGAYRQATDYLTKALSQVAADSKEAVKIRAEMAELPGGQQKK